DKVKDHKRKHDSDDDEDDDDDEGPSAGSNQGRSTKKRRSDSAASGSAKPPPKDDDQSSKKPRKTEASASKQHPALTSIGWNITDTREYGVDSSMHKSDPESEHFEQSLDNISMQDEGNDSDMEDTDNAHIPKTSTTTWFKPIPKRERPATPEPEWTIPPNDFPEPEHDWANAYAYANTLLKVFGRKTSFKGRMYDIGSVQLANVSADEPGKKKALQSLRGPPGQVTNSTTILLQVSIWKYLLTGYQRRKIAVIHIQAQSRSVTMTGLEELVSFVGVRVERNMTSVLSMAITQLVVRRKEIIYQQTQRVLDRKLLDHRCEFCSDGQCQQWF
ncbi:hypothetical protein Tco_0078794, partial [Tanacetum coccineum]